MEKIDVQEMSNKCPTELISLREAGRRLGIPPSTIVYYKDRFERFLSGAGGEGRRKRYPVIVLEIFKEIRDRYGRNLSAEEIEKHLEDISEKTLGRSRKPTGAGSGMDLASIELMNYVTGVLERMSGLAESQKAFRGEIEELRKEIEGLRLERDRLVKTSSERIDSLEREIAKLRKENNEMESYITTRIRQSNRLHSKPSRLFLNLPLVILSQIGEYLGVTDRSKQHFTLKDLIGLLQRGMSADKRVDIEWEHDESGWRLKVTADDKDKAKIRHMVFDLQETITPNKNLVVELTRMVIDGNTVPQSMLLSLFKQIRDGFA